MTLPINQILLGDCLEVMKGFPDKSIDLVVADPPYNIGKADWDKIEGYYDWILKRFEEFQRVLKDNGTLWLFHMSFPVLAKLHTIIGERTDFKFKQFITINKGLQSIAGRASTNLRSYPRATEYLVFYTLQDESVFSNIYKETIKDYMCAELAKFGTMSDIDSIFREKKWCTPKSTFAKHFFGDNNEMRLPSEEMYGRFQKITGRFNKPYKELVKEYKRRLVDECYCFNLPLGVTDVWEFSFYEDTTTYHPTVKPLRLLERIVKSCSNKDDIVLDPFAGSGTTCVVAKKLGRKYIGIDMNSDYVELAKKRVANIPEKLETFIQTSPQSKLLRMNRKRGSSRMLGNVAW